ncbi:GDSL-type esterase/lipase family protein [Luteipulveratus mongoliensis]|uniref:SGNH hydrolase-type esterase domain-containing protein n=1 Tax=Luteipulveratus mongoliensis TaxID=571913 RepID=A0A0K1JDX8_9MICO|nr:GDSL-type esterase/lipase family protein [Luteipulveratus mongoliensis]AKU14922.1 hypothetical protein VV02_01990 [Luteipulveratus mongoliensis]
MKTRARRVLAAGAATTLLTGGLVAVAAVTHAESKDRPQAAARFRVTADLAGRRAKDTSSPEVKEYAKGTRIAIHCQSSGGLANGSHIWDLTADNLWVSDTYVRTGADGFTRALPRCRAGQGPTGASAKAFPVRTDLAGRRARYVEAPEVKEYQAGSKVSVRCQAPGNAANGSRIWDLTSDNLWVSDRYVGTGADGFSPKLRACRDEEGPTLVNPPVPAAPHDLKLPPRPKDPPSPLLSMTKRTSNSLSQRKPRVVAMGDSYASGEGTYVYDNATRQPGNKCHRSPLSWQRTVQLPGLGRADYSNAKIDYQQVACSGAETEDLLRRSRYGEPAQIKALKGGADYVLLSIGGNDLGFAGILTDCVTNPRPCTASPDVRGKKAEIDRFMPKLEEVLRTIDRKSGHATIMLAGYPKILTFGGRHLDCLGISGTEAGTIDGIASHLAIQTAKTVRKLKGEGLRIAYSPTMATFDLTPPAPHGGCAPLRQQWINGLITGSYNPDDGLRDKQERFHPNVIGNVAYALTAARFI